MHDFCDLAQELHIQILSHLDAVSLIRCAMTCTSIYATVQGSSLLAYTIELHRDGLQDAGMSLSYPERIEALRRRRQAWHSLEIKEPLIHVTPPDADTFDLVGGAYANMTKDRIEMLRLPTARSVEAHALQRPSIGRSAVNFAMDPTQDLMVVLEEEHRPQDCRIMRFHIHSISTDAVHPRAQRSPLHWIVIPFPRLNHTHPVGMQIACHIFAVVFSNLSGERQVMAWDWTTLDLILDTSTSSDASLRLLASTDDFKLLDSTHFLITCQSNFGSIRLYKLVSPSDRHETAPRAIHLVTLHFAPTSPGVQVFEICSAAGPIEANPVLDEPFWIADNDRLHMFTVVYGYEAAARHERGSSLLNLFLHQHLLSKYVQKALTNDAPLDIPWAEWGPLNTRLTFASRQYISRSWRRYIHGQRAIFPEDEVRGRSHAVKIVDFSRAAVLLAKGMLATASSESASSSKGKPASTLSLSSTIRTADAPIFLDDVETHLPCVTLTLALERGNEIYMIYADGFVGVNYDGNNFLISIYPI